MELGPVDLKVSAGAVGANQGRTANIPSHQRIKVISWNADAVHVIHVD